MGVLEAKEKAWLEEQWARNKERERAANENFQKLYVTWSDWITKINMTGIHEEGTILPPVEIARVEMWYSFARGHAYDISALCREMALYFEAQAEQGQANMFEKVKLGEYNKKLMNSTDAQYLSRRAKGKLLEKAAKWQGDYLRWKGIGDTYESSVNAVKDMFKVAEHELNKNKYIGSGS